MKKFTKITELIPFDKPLLVFDLESTGLSLSMDRIIEVAYLKIFPNGSAMTGDQFLNPEMNIPEEVVALHGITDERVKSEPTFKEKAQDFWDIFNGCNLSGFNVIGFDLPLLRREFLRAGMDYDYSQAKIIDAKTIYHYMEPRTLSAAYRFYCGREHADAHSALADVEVTADILEKQLEKYGEIRDWDFVYKINHTSDDRYVDNDRKFFWRNGQAHFSFSKYKGESLAGVVKTDPGFLNWILTADFSEETKNIVKKALSGELPKKG
ncbi:MAG: exonuclease domain-containing protein [bacterium]|nr:exonuclease domain-containing protein [bacterium]